VFEEYDRYDGLGLAELIARGELSREELLGEMRTRVAERNPALNAIVELYEDELDRKPSGEGPLAGLPMFLKDLNVYARGHVTANGCRALKHQVADRDSALVRRYREAGLVIAGRTNSPEFGLAPTTEPLLNGPTHNPWRAGVSSGGSSGGASAAVAAGIVPFAHASDGGGSIRIPASACGLFGIKPTRGRVSAAPHAGEGWNGLSLHHVVSRSVRDSAVLLDIAHGAEPGDPYAAPSVEGSFFDATQRAPGTLRIAFSSANPRGLPVHADCEAAISEAARLCESLGHQVEEAWPDYDHDALAGASYGIIGPHIEATIQEIEAKLERPVKDDELEHITSMMRVVAQQQSASEYVAAVRTMHRISREIALFWQRYDVLLTPTLGLPPQPHGRLGFDEGDDYEAFGELMATYVPFSNAANLTGQPSMSVPLHWNEDGLPIGAMFTGAFGDEARLFSLAAQLEEAAPWFDRRPPR
jgi:Asp-tRNA(Asn)/Glu-tRNA(Gln) amidotransferase A subunit family amidase